jgi:hypothetical protein
MHLPSKTTVVRPVSLDLSCESLDINNLVTRFIQIDAEYPARRTALASVIGRRHQQRLYHSPLASGSSKVVILVVIIKGAALVATLLVKKRCIAYWDFP